MTAGGMEAAERTVEPESLDAQLPLGAQEFGASASIDNTGRLREYGCDRSAQGGGSEWPNRRSRGLDW